MSKNKGFSDTSANRYSLALFELASESNLLTQVEENSTSILNLISNNEDFKNFVKDPTLSRDDLLVDFDILGIHNSAIHFLREIQDWQNLLLHKKVSFHDSKNQLKRDLFNPLGNETISLPSSVSFVEKDNECIQMLTPPLTPISMTLWGLSNYEMRSLKMIHAFSI